MSTAPSLDPQKLNRTRTSRWGAHAWTLAIFVGVTTLMVDPLMNYRHFTTAIYPGDPSLVAWVLAWDSHALFTGTPLMSANVFHPAPHSLSYIESHLGLAALGLPIYALTTNPILTYNVLWFAAALCNALACYALARHVALPRLPSAIGAFIYAFSYFRVLHQGHLQLEWSCWFPLVLIAMRVWFRDGRLPALALVLLCVVMQMLVTGYMAVMMVLLVGLYAVWTAGWSLLALRRDAAAAAAGNARRGAHDVHGVPDAMGSLGVIAWRLGAIALAGLVAAAIAWPVYAPYTRLASPETREALMYSATLTSYVLPALGTVAGQALSVCCAVRGGDISGETTLYLGIAAIALMFVAIAGGVSALSDRTRRSPLHAAAPRGGLDVVSPATLWFFVVIGLIAFALSFGPSPDRSGGSWRLFDLVSMIRPVSLFRAPARFALLVVLSVSLLAAIGAAMIAARFGRKGQIVLLAMFPLMVADYRPLAGSVAKPQPVEMTRLYKVLARLPAGALVSLPTFRETPFWWREADYMLYSTRDWRPIVNGYGRAEPEDYDWIVGHMRAFPGENSAKTMRRLGVKYVMLHTDRFADQAEGAAVLKELHDSPDFAILAEDGPVLLVAVKDAATR